MALNAVERRLVQLREHWESFRSDPSKRLLVWRVSGNAVRLTECFFEMQKFEVEYASRDLFIVFEQPFENSLQYSRALKESLKGQYEASRKDLVQQGLAADWDLDPRALPDSATGFIKSLLQFGSKHHQTIGHLVAVLNPSQVTNPNAYVAWLTRCLAANIPERLRLLTVDATEAPRLERFLATNHPLVSVDEPPIDALATAQETFAQEAAVGPAAVFRNYLMGLVTLLEKGSAEQLQTKARDAFQFARKQGWHDQEVVIRTLVAGAFLKEKRFDSAVATYQGARQSAIKVVQAGHPAGQQLVIQTLFGEAGALLAAGESNRAATCYDEAAAVALRIPNLILAIEAHRMAMFCYASGGDRDNAISRGRLALDAGGRLSPEARTMTTLGLAAVDLLRVSDPERLASMLDVKAHLSERVDVAQTSAETRAIDVENVVDPRRVAGIEQDLQREVGRAHGDADRDLQEIAQSAPEEFRQVYARIHELLKTAWPDVLLNAMPAPVAQAAADTDAGMQAS